MAERRKHTAGALAVIAMAAAFCVTSANADEPGMTYESITELPDFGGWWYLDLDSNNVGESLGVVFRAYTPLLKPEIAERLNAPRTSSDTEAQQQDRLNQCSPMIFTGLNGGFEDSIEFLFTPGRVTITSELGLLRRVFLNRPLPVNAGESKMGTSVAHWEGSTLVVQTTGIDRNGSLMSGVMIGAEARIVERISLTNNNTIEIARRVVAPAVLTAPSETTLVYLRDTDHVFNEASHCEQDDRSIDPESGAQRFDLTPPADLPPPPP